MNYEKRKVEENTQDLLVSITKYLNIENGNSKTIIKMEKYLRLKLKQIQTEEK